MHKCNKAPQGFNCLSYNTGFFDKYFYKYLSVQYIVQVLPPPSAAEGLNIIEIFISLIYCSSGSSAFGGGREESIYSAKDSEFCAE